MTENVYDGWKKKTVIFLASQSISLFGSLIVAYAIIWYITLTTTSGTMMTISIVVNFLPQIVISLFAGVWADRYNRKYIIMAADALVAIATLLLAVFFLLGYKQLWLIFLVSAVRSIGSGIQSPSVNAILPQFVPPEKLMRINGIKASILSTAMLLAPAVSGALMTVFSIEVTFFTDVFSAAAAVGILSRLSLKRLHVIEKQGRSWQGFMRDIKAGGVYVRRNKLIFYLLIYYLFFFFLISPAAFLTPLMVARSFGSEVWRLTLNEVFFSGGAILGGIIISTWGGLKDRVYTIALACLGFGVCTTLLGLANQFALYLIIMGITGIFMPIFNAAETVLIQENVDNIMQGRVFSIIEIISSAVMPVAMLVFGPFADIVRVESILLATGSLIVLLAIAIYTNHRKYRTTA